MAPPDPMTIAYLGAKAGSFTGSMSEGSNLLTLTTAAHHFRVGDRIIVEIGGEAGEGARATVGVGGTWPANSFADESAIIASGEPDAVPSGHGDPAAYAEDTGTVYYWSAAQWNATTTSVFNQHKFIPLALVALVNAVDGATLTLDASATVATSGASVWYDCHPVLSQVIASANGSFRVAPGEYAVSKRLTQASAISTVHLFGDSKETCKIFSPRGCASLGLMTSNCRDWTIEDLWTQGCMSVEGTWHGLQGYSTLGSILLQLTNADRGVFRRLKLQDGMSAEISCSGTDIEYRDIEAVETAARSHYEGRWAIQIHQATDSHAYDCSFTGPYLREAFELFQTTDCGFHGITSVNGIVNTNGSVRPVFEDVDVRATAGSARPTSVDPNSGASFLLQWGNQTGAASANGGSLTNARFEQEGALGEGLTFSVALATRHSALNAAQDGFTWSSVAFVTNVLCRAINAEVASGSAQSLTLDGVTADAEIKLDDGTVQNSTGPLLTYCGDNVTLGDGNDFDTITDRCA